MNKTNEIKRILLGRIANNEDGLMIARPQGDYTQVNGFVDGYFSVLLFGVMSRTRTYRWEGEKQKETATMKRYIQQLGRELQLEEHPDAIACFTGRLVLTPTVVLVEFLEAGKLKKPLFSVTVYTARSPFGILRCIAMHRRICHLMGDLCEPQKKDSSKKKDARKKKDAGKKKEQGTANEQDTGTE